VQKVDGHVTRVAAIVRVGDCLGCQKVGCVVDDSGEGLLEVAQRLILIPCKACSGETNRYLGGLDASECAQCVECRWRGA
jgi:hypothetical protein